MYYMFITELIIKKNPVFSEAVPDRIYIIKRISREDYYHVPLAFSRSLTHTDRFILYL